MDRILLFIPTFNEFLNVKKIFYQITDILKSEDIDILFIDDNSPDGTGKLLDSLAVTHPNLIVKHRSSKQGIGGAHLAGINFAYREKYDYLITMDCDFTHQPKDLPRLIARAKKCDLVIGSRYMQDHSLLNWSLLRRFLTNLAHFLTKTFLGIHEDASAGLRVYNLKTIPYDIIAKIKSKSYSFFFESLFYIKLHGMKVSEVAVVLHPRSSGKSKMNLKEVWRSGLFFLKLAMKRHTLNGMQVTNPESVKNK